MDSTRERSITAISEILLSTCIFPYSLFLYLSPPLIFSCSLLQPSPSFRSLSPSSQLTLSFIVTFSSFTSLVTPGVDGVHILRVFGTPIVSLPLLLYFFISVSLSLAFFFFLLLSIRASVCCCCCCCCPSQG